MTEAELIARLVKRDGGALEELMDRFLPYVSAVVGRVLRPALTREDAEEVAADVFVAAWDHAGELRPGKLRPWLGAVARNRAKNRLRDRGFTLPMEGEALTVAAAGTPETETQERELRAYLRDQVEGLGRPDRDIFIRYYYDGQPVAVIGAALGMPENTVKTRLRRGRQRLREELERGGYCCETVLE